MTEPRRYAAHDDLLRPSRVARDYGIDVETLRHYRRNGIGPDWFHLSPRVVVYRRSVVEAWIASREKATA